MSSFPHRLDRSVVIQATPETVFRFLTETSYWAKWWGEGSTIDSREGGKVYIRFPGGTEVVGEVVSVQPPRSIVFTYGFAKGSPVPVGGSRVSIRLEADRAGTRLKLSHEFAEATARDEHVQGWRHQLAVFGNVVSDLVNEKATDIVDAWFGVWAEPDAATREQQLASIAGTDLRFRDRHGNTDSVADLLPHIAAAQHFMPGIRLRRKGNVRHCQGTALADWTAAGPDGQAKGEGTNVFVFGPDGRIESVTGVSS